jgi:hypothetical protein
MYIYIYIYIYIHLHILTHKHILAHVHQILAGEITIGIDDIAEGDKEKDKDNDKDKDKDKDKDSWLKQALHLDAAAVKQELAWQEEQDSLDQLIQLGALTDQQVCVLLCISHVALVMFVALNLFS